MADRKISQMPLDTQATGSEIVPVVENGTNKILTTQQIADLSVQVGTNLSYNAADRLLSSSTGDDVTLPEATTSVAGLMSAAQATRLAAALIVGDSAPGIVDCRNNSGAGINIAQPVYVTSSSGTYPTVALANASSEATAARTLGLAYQTVNNNADVKVITHGMLSGINTSALTEGQAVWLSETTGQLTSTRPVQPAHGVFLGFCIKQGAGSSGILFVQVINGQELSELHDILFTSPTAGQGLRLNASGLWVNADGPPQFIQSSQPTSGQLAGAVRYSWWDTSGGNLTLWIEDGI